MRKKTRTPSAPAPAELFNQLLAHLDDCLNEEDCNHTHRFTEDFLGEADTDAEEVLAWLVEQGGACDCEIVAILEQEFGE